MPNYNQVPLSDKTKEIILGSLLGDGSLKKHKGYKNARFSFKHSETQKEYFFWKVNQLKEIAANNSVFRQTNDGGYSKNQKLRFQSRALEALTELYDLTHKVKKFHIRRKWLNQMTPLSLAIWWQDDGSLISNTRKGVFCTDGFTQEQVKSLARYLEVEWDIKTHVASVSRSRDSKQEEYFRLWIRSTAELKKFLRLIMPHIKVPEMLLKVIILYNDHSLQQRWISEISQKTGFSKAIINKYVAEKQSKWQKYQKKI
ncbi:MAG: hypothetical protein COU22_00080 [Candidatus Komeilibacteria bacterium CG10_big_fil_rev_8_21_14_0_10_41_13]|uniref:Homing endonuclease LAGLIDADG domain-containing protein n=1 Tax=Candidatus Komeilibacteria bacterium CG10_big_fil_rev_8_21_14_0_10_41_13 TaxID=1974476 RepID=A0A2M6WDE6_9BACT|nr:MAG: hypothetical protein COU22_00080 [Candidatus Komeilibacteria bacterium CG10_big_fil_rev_8_21_14_0_10_41_13]